MEIGGCVIVFHPAHLICFCFGLVLNLILFYFPGIGYAFVCPDEIWIVFGLPNGLFVTK